MKRALARILVGLAAFLGAAALGLFLTTRIAYDSLRLEVEERLTQAIGAPVQIGKLRLGVGFGLRLEGTDVKTWAGASRGPSLQVDRIRARVRPASLLLGKPRLGRITFEGAELRIARDAEGNWRPPPFAALAASRREPERGERGYPDELLSPLIALENAVRGLLAKPFLANTLEVRNSTVVFVDARAEDALAPPLILALVGVQAQLRHSRLAGTNRLSIRARLVDAQRERGSVEWEGTRDRHGAVRVAMAVTDLEVEALAPYVRAIQSDARFEGTVSGTVVFETSSPGEGQLEVDLIGVGIKTALPPPIATTVSANHIDASGTLEITPQYVRLRGLRFRGGELDLEMDGTVERPLQPSSFAQIALFFREVEVVEVRHLIGWLPEVERREAMNVVKVVESGRLHSLRAGGAATLSGWQAFLAGRTRTPPADFVVDATLADTVVKVGEDDRLENLSGRLWWSGNHAEVVGARAILNGSPLPVVDIAVDGVTNFLAGDPERRRLASGAVPLVGLRALWESLQPDPEKPDRPGFDVSLNLSIDRLHHPMFLWPIEDLSAAIWNTERGLHIRADRGTWAGIPISGEADWFFEPEEHLTIRVDAGTPGPRPAATAPPKYWAEGSVAVGVRQDGPWGQQFASGRFRAEGGLFHFQGVEMSVNPRGHLEATLALELGRPDAVPFELDFALRGGSVAALSEQLGQPPGLATGTVDLAGSFQGTLHPEGSIFDDLSGLLDVVAVDGKIRRSLPAVVAIALASEAYNPFTRREEVRYAKFDSLLEFGNGRVSTEGFSLDGPDLRVFAAGELDLARPPHEIDAQVALFLFRQIDSLLGKIPVVNLLLLGMNENLVGAHFRLTGPWDDPKATSVPLSALATGPAGILEQGPTSMVLQSVPMFMIKGIQALESMLGIGKPSKPREGADEPPASAEEEP